MRQEWKHRLLWMMCNKVATVEQVDTQQVMPEEEAVSAKGKLGLLQAHHSQL